MGKIGLFLLSLGVAIVIVFQPVCAAEFVSSSDSETPLIIEAPATPRNLFAIAPKIIIRPSQIGKDLFSIGQEIELDSSIEHNAFLLGAKVQISGSVGGNVFVLGEKLKLSGVVDGDVFILGSEVVIEEDAEIRGQLYVLAESLIIRGKVMDHVFASCSSCTVSGSILGRMTLRAQAKLEIKKGAFIQFLDYRSPVVAVIEEGAEIKDSKYEVIETQKPKKHSRFPWAKIIGFFAVLNWLSSIILGIFFVTLFKKHTRKVVAIGYKQFGLCIAFGLSFLFAVSLGVFFLFFTLIGYKLALSIGFFGLMIWNITPTLAGIFAGVMIQYWIGNKKHALENYVNWIAVLAGITLYQVLFLIPVLGWFVRVVLCLSVIGAILSYVFGTLRISDDSLGTAASTAEISVRES